MPLRTHRGTRPMLGQYRVTICAGERRSTTGEIRYSEVGWFSQLWRHETEENRTPLCQTETLILPFGSNGSSLRRSSTPTVPKPATAVHVLTSCSSKMHSNTILPSPLPSSNTNTLHSLLLSTSEMRVEYLVTSFIWLPDRHYTGSSKRVPIKCPHHTLV
jgi:hypothetical protein